VGSRPSVAFLEYAGGVQPPGRFDGGDFFQSPLPEVGFEKRIDLTDVARRS
jgi:hypothetical protein